MFGPIKYPGFRPGRRKQRGDTEKLTFEEGKKIATKILE